MDTEQLLLQLKDIEPPPAPPWWLLAPGHGLAALVLLSIIVFAWWLFRRQRADRLVLLADLELDRIRRHQYSDQAPLQFAAALSRWLKRVALEAFPGQGLQAMHGDRWLQFLDQSLGEARFSQGCGRIFGEAMYQPQPEFDAEEVFALCKQWLQAVSPRLRERGRVR